MRSKILFMSVLILIFCAEAEAGKIFLVTKDAKLYKKDKIENDYLILSQGKAYEIDNSFKDKNQVFIKLKLKGSAYTFVEKENGVEKEYGSWPISKFEQPKPLTPEDIKAREEHEKRYDELMDQAWGGKERYSVTPDPTAGRNQGNKQIPTSGEQHGWISSNSCFVVRQPDENEKVVGFIVYRAAVTVEDSGLMDWLKIIFAPVRDHKLNFIDCKGCYIRRGNFSTTLPPKR